MAASELYARRIQTLVKVKRRAFTDYTHRKVNMANQSRLYNDIENRSQTRRRVLSICKRCLDEKSEDSRLE